MDIGHLLDNWRQRVPEDNIIGYCENCGEALYDEEYIDYCSEDCVIEYYNLSEIDVEDELYKGSLKDDSVCECCGEPIANWSYCIKDADGELYCDVNCFIKQNI